MPCSVGTGSSPSDPDIRGGRHLPAPAFERGTPGTRPRPRATTVVTYRSRRPHTISDAVLWTPMRRAPAPRWHSLPSPAGGDPRSRRRSAGMERRRSLQAIGAMRRCARRVLGPVRPSSRADGRPMPFGDLTRGPRPVGAPTAGDPALRCPRSSRRCRSPQVRTGPPSPRAASPPDRPRPAGRPPVAALSPPGPAASPRPTPPAGGSRRRSRPSRPPRRRGRRRRSPPSGPGPDRPSGSTGRPG